MGTEPRQVSAPGLGLGPWVATMASTPQVLLTGLLQLCLFAITDKRNNPAQQGTQAVVIGLLVVIIGVSLGMNSGYAINPSRDLPPRFFTFIAGWGVQVFRYCPAQPIPASFLRGPRMWRDGGSVRGSTGAPSRAPRRPRAAEVGAALPRPALMHILPQMCPCP